MQFFFFDIESWLWIKLWGVFILL